MKWWCCGRTLCKQASVAIWNEITHLRLWDCPPSMKSFSTSRSMLALRKQGCRATPCSQTRLAIFNNLFIYNYEPAPPDSEMSTSRSVLARQISQHRIKVAKRRISRYLSNIASLNDILLIITGFPNVFIGLWRKKWWKFTELQGTFWFQCLIYVRHRVMILRLSMSEFIWGHSRTHSTFLMSPLSGPVYFNTPQEGMWNSDLLRHLGTGI
jgi:hypothetical protein